MNSQSYLQEFIKECSEAKPASTDEKFVGWENIIFIERNRFESSQATHRNRAVGLYFGLLV